MCVYIKNDKQVLYFDDLNHKSMINFSTVSLKMEKSQGIKLIVLIYIVGTVHVIALPNSKVFNYQGEMPIKDENTGQLIKNDSNSTTETPSELEDAEAACWQLINEQTGKY